MVDALGLLRRMWDHAVWADLQLWDAVAANPGGQIWKEYAHILGAEEVWLARLERRASRAAVWPELGVEDAAALRRANEEGYARLLGRLRPDELDVPIEYRNTAGLSFSSTPADIITHVALHGQYHRGKINLLLRQQEATPMPVDCIAFLRGSPAATRMKG